MGPNNNPLTGPPAPATQEAIDRRRRTLSLRLDPRDRHHHHQPSPPPFDPPHPPQTQTSPPPHFWPTPAPAALYGLAGQAVRTIAPHTEADPAAILLQFLAAFGNLLGPGPHCIVESTRHHLNLFVVLVGESSKARKGTSWSHICRLLSEVDQSWLTQRVTNALLNADGLIHALRDGVSDRRLLVLAEEFASLLQMLGRYNGHLSPLLRCAWDSGHLRTLDRHHPLQANGTHITLIGHITQHELAPLIRRNESHNGFAKRCLWACVRRSQCLPQGGSLTSADLSPIAQELRRSLEWAAGAAEHPFECSHRAQELWNDRYPTLSESRPGLHGAVTSRAEAQVLRLSALYAALDSSSVIEQLHLEAALAVREKLGDMIDIPDSRRPAERTRSDWISGERARSVHETPEKCENHFRQNQAALGKRRRPGRDAAASLSPRIVVHSHPVHNEQRWPDTHLCGAALKP